MDIKIKLEYFIVIFCVIVIVGLIYNYNIFENFNSQTDTNISTPAPTQEPTSPDTNIPIINKFDIKEINKNFVIFQIDIISNDNIKRPFTINVRVETYLFEPIKNDYVLVKSSVIEYDNSITEDKIILDDKKEYYYKISAFLKIDDKCVDNIKYYYPDSMGDKPFKLGIPLNKQIMAMAMVDNMLSAMQENNLYYAADGNCDSIKNQLGNYPNNLLYKNVSLDDIAAQMLHTGILNVNLK